MRVAFKSQAYTSESVGAASGESPLVIGMFNIV